MDSIVTGLSNYFGKTLSISYIYWCVCLDGKGYLYEYGWHINDLELRGYQETYPLSTPVRIGGQNYKRICVSRVSHSVYALVVKAAR